MEKRLSIICPDKCSPYDSAGRSDGLVVKVFNRIKAGLVQQEHWQKGEQASPAIWFESSPALVISTESLLWSV